MCGAVALAISLPSAGAVQAQSSEYLDFDDLTDELRTLVNGSANASMRSIGTSHEGRDVWQALEAGSKIHLGDTFHAAAKSSCVLRLGPKSTLELNQNSMLVLEVCNGETEFLLEHGELAADLASPHDRFFISTPLGRVEALGTEFTVAVTDE